MSNFWKQLSLVPSGVRTKLVVAFCMMSGMPLVVLLLVSAAFVFPSTREPVQEFLKLSSSNDFTMVWWGTAIMVSSLLAALVGRSVIGEVIEPIIKIATNAKDIADGKLDHIEEVEREDELGDISTSLNAMSSRIRDNMNELKLYGERTRAINLDIHKRVMALSGLL